MLYSQRGKSRKYFTNQQKMSKIFLSVQVFPKHQILLSSPKKLSCVQYCLHLFCYRLVPIPIPTSNYKSEEQKAELAANLIQDTKGIGNYELIHSSLKHLLKDTTLVDEVHISQLWIDKTSVENFLSGFDTLTTALCNQQQSN